MLQVFLFDVGYEIDNFEQIIGSHFRCLARIIAASFCREFECGCKPRIENRQKIQRIAGTAPKIHRYR